MATHNTWFTRVSELENCHEMKGLLLGCLHEVGKIRTTTTMLSYLLSTNRSNLWALLINYKTIIKTKENNGICQFHCKICDDADNEVSQYSSLYPFLESSLLSEKRICYCT